MQQQGKKKAPLAKGERNSWPPLRGGSARRRWGREPCGYPKHFGPWQGSLPPALRGHLPRRGRQELFLRLLFRFGAFAVAAGTVAAAAALPAAVLADEQDRQRQQHKNNHNNDNTCHIVYYLIRICRGAFRRGSHQAEHRSYTVYHKCHDPCNTALHQNDACCGAGTAQLTLDGSNRGHAGRVQQGKHQKHDARERGKQRGQCSGVPAQKDRQRRDNALLGRKAGDQRSGNAPVAKAQRPEQGSNKTADGRQQALVRRSGHVQAHVKGLQEPDQHRCHKDNGEGLLQKVTGFLPNQLADTARRGKTVVGQLHDEGDRLALVLGEFQQDRVQDAAQDGDSYQEDSKASYT